MIDPYIDRASGVLRNRLGITNQADLEAAEAAIVWAADLALYSRPLAGEYDLPHLQSFHRQLFGAIYPWAGELRTVEIAKGASFCPVRNLVSFAEEVFSRLKRHDYLRNLARDPFVSGLADYLGDINALHPFREGNGRVQRAFLRQLGREAGYGVYWERMDAARNIEVSIHSFHGDNEPLRQMLDELVEELT